MSICRAGGSLARNGSGFGNRVGKLELELHACHTGGVQPLTWTSVVYTCESLQ